MKLILLDRTGNEPVEPIDQSRIIADSAIVPIGRPVFLPDFTDRWKADIYLAYRISRLGKSVKSKFASRYYDAVGLALHILPSTTDTYRHVAAYLDNSLATGPFIPVESIAQDDTAPLSVNHLTLYHNPRIIDTAIERISEYCTLKNGDLILPVRHAESIEITRGDNITINLPHSPSLDLKFR